MKTESRRIDNATATAATSAIATNVTDCATRCQSAWAANSVAMPAASSALASGA